jgi:hypothetical protein
MTWQIERRQIRRVSTNQALWMKLRWSRATFFFFFILDGSFFATLSALSSQCTPETAQKEANEAMKSLVNDWRLSLQACR